MKKVLIGAIVSALAGIGVYSLVKYTEERTKLTLYPLKEEDPDEGLRYVE